MTRYQFKTKIFQPTLPARGATAGSDSRAYDLHHFNPRSPHGERRPLSGQARLAQDISTHAPRTGSDVPAAVILADIRLFQPTLPARGATVAVWTIEPQDEHFNPRSPHGERLGTSETSHASAYFNPRSPHGERHSPRHAAVRSSNFNPRSPHGERRNKSEVADIRHHFNPRSPHGERPAHRHGRARPQKISTHAPRTGSDARLQRKSTSRPRFQPTLPARGATKGRKRPRKKEEISTHAPRTGSDAPVFLTFPDFCKHFNPRSPHGERLNRCIVRGLFHYISTHAPRTGSDCNLQDVLRGTAISTHAPRTGSDPCVFLGQYASQHFNPRSPHGERPNQRLSDPATSSISTHAPRTGSDAHKIWNSAWKMISTHAPRTGSDKRKRQNHHKARISTHAPRTGSDNAPSCVENVPKLFQPTLPARGATRSASVLQALRCSISTHAPRTGSDI